MAGCGRNILLKDVRGFKAEGGVKSAIKKMTGGDQYSTVNVLRGELVEEYAMPGLNFSIHLCRDPTIFMSLSHDDLAPLSAEEFLLLEGIEQASDRFATLRNGGVELGMNLGAGSRVYVEVNVGHVKSKQARATVQFKGKVQGRLGTTFGVEIAVRYNRCIIVCPSRVGAVKTVNNFRTEAATDVWFIPCKALDEAVKVIKP